MITSICSVCKNVTLPSCLMICISVCSFVKYTPLTCWPLLPHLIPVAYQESYGCVCPIQLGMACIRNSWIYVHYLYVDSLSWLIIYKGLWSVLRCPFLLFLWTSSCPFIIYLLALHSQLHKKSLGEGGGVFIAKQTVLITLVSVLPVSLVGILGGIIHRVPPFLVAVADPGAQFSMMWYMYRPFICGGNSESPLYSPWGKCSIFANRTNLFDHSLGPNPLQLNPGYAIALAIQKRTASPKRVPLLHYFTTEAV